jgi:hypothetical protein
MHGSGDLLARHLSKACTKQKVSMFRSLSLSLCFSVGLSVCFFVSWWTHNFPISSTTYLISHLCKKLICPSFILSMMTFLPDLVVSELPIHLVAALVWSLARLKASRKFDVGFGPAISGFSLYSLILSMRLLKWNIDSTYTLRAVMKNEKIGQLTLRRTLAILSQNFTLLAEECPVDVHRNIKYGDVLPNSNIQFLRTFGWEGQSMDVYVPKNPSDQNGTKMPVFFYIHGGGWVTGDKAFASLPLLYQVASHGWLVVTVNYRLSGPGPKGGVSFPSHLIDIKRALACVRSDGGIADAYGGNKHLVVCSG